MRQSITDDAELQFRMIGISDICVGIRNSRGAHADSMVIRIRHYLLEEVIRQFGCQERSLANHQKPFLALYGADHIGDKGAALVRKSNIVLIASGHTNPLKGAFGDSRTIWFNRLTRIEMDQSFQQLHPPKPQAFIKSTAPLNSQTGCCATHISIPISKHTTPTHQHMSRSASKMIFAAGRARSAATIADNGCPKTIAKPRSPLQTMQPSARI